MFKTLINARGTKARICKIRYLILFRCPQTLLGTELINFVQYAISKHKYMFSRPSFPGPNSSRYSANDGLYLIQSFHQFGCAFSCKTVIKRPSVLQREPSLTSRLQPARLLVRCRRSFALIGQFVLPFVFSGI